MTTTPTQIGSPAASSTLARPGLTLLILSGAAFMASLDVFIVNVAFDDISSDFDGSTLSQMSWIPQRLRDSLRGAAGSGGADRRPLRA